MKRNMALLCALLLSTAQYAQNVEKVQIGDNQNFGITYTLPQTEICATIKAIVENTSAGIYAPYAEKYLGLTNVATFDQTKWEILSISLEGVPVADKTKTYHIDFSAKGGLPQFYLSETGNLLSINREPEYEERKVVEQVEEQKKLVLKATDVLSEDILKATSKAKQAELTAREIFSLRESRRELLRGELENMPSDGAGIQLILDRLNAEEQALLSLFIGTTTTTTVEKTISFTPLNEVDSKKFFRFSSIFGFVDVDDWVGEPYYLSVKITDDNRMVSEPTDNKKKPSTGIAYNVPGKARVSLSFDGETIAEGILPMAQFGHVEQLPANRFTDKKAAASALFNSLTGSIKIYTNE